MWEVDSMNIDKNLSHSIMQSIDIRIIDDFR